MSTKSEPRGNATFQATFEIVSENGFRILLGDREVFVAFDRP